MKIGLGGPSGVGTRSLAAHRELGGGLSIRMPQAAGAALLGSQKPGAAATVPTGGPAADRPEPSADRPKPGSDRSGR